MCQTQYVRRGDLEEIQCVTLLKHVLYERNALNEGSTSEWTCQMLPTPSYDGTVNIFELEGLDTLDEPEIVEDFESGVTRIIIPGAIIRESSIIIPQGTHIHVNNDGSVNVGPNAAAADNIFEDHVRKLTEGTKRVIVIRVVDSKGVKTTSMCPSLAIVSSAQMVTHTT